MITEKNKREVMIMKRRKIALAVLVAVLCTGCGSGGIKNATESMSAMENTYTDSYEGTDYADETEVFYEDEIADSSQEESGMGSDHSTDTTSTEPEESQRKLIRTIDMDVETLEYDEALAFIQEKVKKLNGYIEYSSTEGSSIYSGEKNRYGELKIRIPKKKADEFVSGLSDKVNIIRKNESIEDITLNYVDVESHKKALQVEQERLLAILEKAETVEDIISVEERLSQVRYEIGQYESTLRTYDNQVDYTTIQMCVTEVQEITEPEEESSWKRMTTGFVHSLVGVIQGIREFVIGLVICLPYLVVWGLIIAGIALAIKKICKHHKKKKEQQRNQQLGRNSGNLNQPAGQMEDSSPSKDKS